MTLLRSRCAHRSAATLLLGAVVVLGCADDRTPFEVIEETAFASSLGIDLTMYTRLPDGIYLLDETVGSGTELTGGDIAEVDHIGWLSDGRQFSAGVFEFVAVPIAECEADEQCVIPGFRLGTLGMRVGGVRRIIIPPALAYGSSPPPGIPVGAILVFEVELLGVRSR